MSKFFLPQKHTREEEFPHHNCSHRESDKWRKIYSHRSSIERWFAVLKEHLALAEMTRRGIHKSFVDVMITIITFLAGTLAQVLMKNRLQKAA